MQPSFEGLPIKLVPAHLTKQLRDNESGRVLFAWNCRSLLTPHRLKEIVSNFVPSTETKTIYLPGGKVEDSEPHIRPNAAVFGYELYFSNRKLCRFVMLMIRSMTVDGIREPICFTH